MVSKKEIQTNSVPPNYDYTGKDRVNRQRKTLKESGGKRVEAPLDAGELAKLDALAAARFNGSRSAALKYLVQQLPERDKKN